MRNVADRIRAKHQADRREWYRIENKKNDTATVYLFDEIGYDPWFDVGVSAQDFVKEISGIKAKTIELHINSPGGVAFDGLTIYNALRDHDARIEVVVDGLAASAASIVAMAGDQVTMNRASELMIHDASGLCWGNASEMDEMRAILDRLSADIAAVYADRAGGTVASWRETMRGEQWYSAQEAVDAGLADRVVELKEEDAEKAKNRFDLSIFAHAGRSHAPAPKLRATNSGLRRDSVPANTGGKPEDGMTPEQLAKIGLPEDATDEQINERLAELAEAEPATGDGTQAQTDDTTGGDGSGTTTEGTTEAGTPGEPTTGATSTEGSATPAPQNFTPPPGTVLVDAEAHAASQKRLGEVENKLVAMERKEAEAHKSAVLNAAQKAGKFRASERSHYEGMWAIDAAGTEKLVNALASNTVPVEEIGHGGGADIENKAEDEYPAEWGNLLRAQEVKA